MIHKRCRRCGKIGHKPEMVKHVWQRQSYKEWAGSMCTAYYDPKCYAEEFKVEFVYSFSEQKYVWVKK